MITLLLSLVDHSTTVQNGPKYCDITSNHNQGPIRGRLNLLPTEDHYEALLCKCQHNLGLEYCLRIKQR